MPTASGATTVRALAYLCRGVSETPETLTGGRCGSVQQASRLGSARNNANSVRPWESPMKNSAVAISFLVWALCLLGGEWPDDNDSSRAPVTRASSTFDCLKNAKEIERITGVCRAKVKFAPAKNKGFDARGARFIITNAKWGMADIKGSEKETGMCWVGGYFSSDKPWNASWRQHKDVDSTGGGRTRNSCPLTIRAPHATISGVHVFNVHDGFRTTNSPDWRVEHVWGEYIRDDALENDGQCSGVLYDSLLDGCFVGISTRGDDGGSPEAAKNTVVLDTVLLRLTPQPYGFKWQERGFNYSEGEVPMGQGLMFKTNDPARTPKFIIRNCMFCLYFDESPANGRRIDFPRSIIKEASGNTIVWLGKGEFRGEYDRDAFSVTDDENVWKRAVREWHERHPEVGKQRKPSMAEMGDTTIMNKF